MIIEENVVKNVLKILDNKKVTTDLDLILDIISVLPEKEKVLKKFDDSEYDLLHCISIENNNVNNGKKIILFFYKASHKDDPGIILFKFDSDIEFISNIITSPMKTDDKINFLKNAHNNGIIDLDGSLCTMKNIFKNIIGENDNKGKNKE